MTRNASIAASILLAASLSATAACRTIGGADIRLEGLALGLVVMEGKPVSGLPSDKVNLLLDVSARRIVVTSRPDGTVTITVDPSGQTIEIKANSVSIQGTKPDQVKVEWTAPAKKP